MLGLAGPGEYLGLRPGEIFHCIHANKHISGCGTSKHCRVCGAVQVILSSQKQNNKASGECRITAEIEGEQFSFDLMVSSSPIIIGESCFYIINMIDISHEKRRRLLERVFFHDIINSAGNILIFSQLASKPEKRERMIPLLLAASEQLMDDINAQKKLLDAENNELVLRYETLQTRECLEFILKSYNEFAAVRNVHLHLYPWSKDIQFECDKSVILRVLGNMIKNSLEASSDKDVVTIGCDNDDGMVRFWVNNPQYMPEDVQMQIFQRSFSTKGVGRGLGTYSIKLLSEKYLGGKVTFNSSEHDGTTFAVTLPLSGKKYF